MSEIRFYHLERQSLEQALPALLSKALENGHKIVVKTPDIQTRERLNDHLWAFDQGSFLPHGTAKDGHAEAQPIWITEQDENPNGADVLILTGSVESELVSDFKLTCEIFDGRNDEQLQTARTRWKNYKESELEMTYWQQGQKGWEKKF